MRSTLGIWQLPIYLGAAISLLTLFWLRRPGTAEQFDLEQAQIEFDRQVRWQTSRLERREQALAHQLLQAMQWDHMPAPVDLASRQIAEEVENDQPLAELLKKDQLVLELLQTESEIFFEKIRKNEYLEDGKFQPTLLRDDVYTLIKNVAQVYQPEIEQPILETSFAQVIQAAGRASLHFLVVLDQLPLSVKDYNLNTLYDYAKRAVTAFGAYKKVEPYIFYANAAYRIGRIAFGANPVTMVLGFAAWQLGGRAAGKLTERYVNYQAIKLLHDLVRVIGFEVASIYGGDFRHRDANWIYGVELTELISSFVLTRESLSQALKEVSALQLRSEYDRIYLYRMLAEQKSAGPDRFRGRELLSAAERQAVASRLERFLNSFIESRSSTRVARWQSDLEERLNVKVRLPDETTDRPRHEQAADAFRSLASFVVSVKQVSPGELSAVIGDDYLSNHLESAKRDELFEAIAEDPPAFFEQPEIDPSSDLAKDFISDLVRLAVRTPPNDVEADEMVIDCAAYLRQDLKTVRRELDREYVDCLAKKLRDQTMPRRVTSQVARAVLGLTDSDGELRFLYGNVSLEISIDHDHGTHALWLVGISDRVLLLSVGHRSRLLWQADETTEFKRERNLLSAKLRIAGGEWLDGEFESKPNLVVTSEGLRAGDSYFRPLEEILVDVSET